MINAEQEDEDSKIAGSTATVALVRRDKVIVANVGDSRAVISRNGQAVNLSTEHRRVMLARLGCLMGKVFPACAPKYVLTKPLVARWCRVFGKGPTVESETKRVTDAGGWVKDGRVCEVLAVSRAFGDWEFKGEGLPVMLERGRECAFRQTFGRCICCMLAAPPWSHAGWVAWKNRWTSACATAAAAPRCGTRRLWTASHFVADPVVATPDVTEMPFGPDDEFLLLASDGLWCAAPCGGRFLSWRRHARGRACIRLSDGAPAWRRRAGTSSAAGTQSCLRGRRFQAGASCQEVADKVAELALKRYTSDNVAVVVVDLGGGAKGWGAPTAKAKGGLFGIFN